MTLTGSTEWGEHFADELKAKAVAYLNVDSSASGPSLGVSAVGTLAPMIEELTGDLADPSGGTLHEAWRTATTEASTLPTGARSADGLVVTRIGSGSDHTVFINHLGVPVVEMSFSGPYGVYHSAYDSHYWVSRLGDPGFRYPRLMTQLWGTMALRLANAALLPLDVEVYAAALSRLRRPARRDSRPRGAARPAAVDRGGADADRSRPRAERPHHGGPGVGTTRHGRGRPRQPRAAPVRAHLARTTPAFRVGRGSSTCSSRRATPTPR